MLYFPIELSWQEFVFIPSEKKAAGEIDKLSEGN